MCFILVLLVLASQRLESIIIKSINSESVPKWLQEANTWERGQKFTLTEWLIIIYVLGYIWQEATEMWHLGILEYKRDMWNIVDFSTQLFFICWVVFRYISIITCPEEDVRNSRGEWNAYDSTLISEAMFGAANILSFLKTVHIFSIHPNLGPLQISLGRMVYDIIKFFFIYALVLFAFASGINHVLRYDPKVN